jgi:type IV secretory pathway VirB10-like protein
MGSRRGLFVAALLACVACVACACLATGTASAAELAISPAATEAPAIGPTTPAQSIPAQTTPAPTIPAQTTPGVPTQQPTTPAQPTSAQTTPAQPAVPATTPVTPVTSTPAGGGSGSVLLWTLVAVGAVALIGLIAWLVSASSRRSDQTAAWQSRRRDAFALGAALHDAIMAGEEQWGRLAPAEEAVRRADVQRRADDFTQRLYQLREVAPDEDGRARVEGALVSLRALRSAVDAEHASGAQAGMTAQLTRERLSDFRGALHALRGDYY